MNTTEANGRYRTRALEDEFTSCVRTFNGDAAGRAAGDAYLAGTHALYHGEATPWALTPKIFDAATIELLRDAAETMYAIMDKVTRAYCRDSKVREAFGFKPGLENLCALDAGYDCQIPLARVDIFLNEETGTYKFCELNTDGSAGMVTTDEVNRAIALTPSFATFAAAHPNLKTFDLCEGWADALLATYEDWRGGTRAGTAAGEGIDANGLATSYERPEKPAIAIVDFTESIDAEDVAYFVELFCTRGIAARFADVRDLHIERDVDGRDRLYDTHGPIDCVWRRAVTGEFWEKACDGTSALAKAAERNLCCIVGSFRTWPCATKTIFALLWSNLANGLLTERELAFVREHIPYTERVDAATDLARFAEKDRWIVKPSGGYNSVGVLAGLDADEATWADALEQTARTGGIVQEYAPQYTTPCLRGTLIDGEHRGAPEPSITDEMDFAPASNMEGLFLFNGKFAGVYTRAGFANTIGEWSSRLNVGCFYLDE